MKMKISKRGTEKESKKGEKNREKKIFALT
jgi:hypothetical protein